MRSRTWPLVRRFPREGPAPEQLVTLLVPVVALVVLRLHGLAGEGSAVGGHGLDRVEPDPEVADSLPRREPGDPRRGEDAGGLQIESIDRTEPRVPVWTDAHADILSAVD